MNTENLTKNLHWIPILFIMAGLGLYFSVQTKHINYVAEEMKKPPRYVKAYVVIVANPHTLYLDTLLLHNPFRVKEDHVYLDDDRISKIPLTSGDSVVLEYRGKRYVKCHSFIDYALFSRKNE